ncbi:hypothetical protein I4U23_031200 [Adineta vaga]|nr:hypothetical protein I4U23_031200 [Adineta vaga]
MVIHFNRLGRVSPATNAYCKWWTFLEYTLNGAGEMLMATISIQRHIIVFNAGAFKIRSFRYLFHHLPLLLYIVYPLIRHQRLIRWRKQHRELYGVEMHAEPNFPTLGKKAGGKVKVITEKIRGMTDADIEKLLSKDATESPLTTIEEIPIEHEDVHIVYRVAKQIQFEATAEQGFVVLLDYTADASLKDDGLVREITSRVQKLRKEAKVKPTDEIVIYYSVEPQTSEIARIAVERQNEITTILGKSFLPLDKTQNHNIIKKEKITVKDGEIEFVITQTTN